LWQRLRRHQLKGLKFKRQHQIGKYIVDFYCGELNLVMELEGAIHEKPLGREYDKKRFDEFKIRGLNVLRIRNEEVFEKIEEVLNRISTLSLGPSPKPVLSEVEGWERDVTK
jgi:very-short-patch-repair endonuclease